MKKIANFIRTSGAIQEFLKDEKQSTPSAKITKTELDAPTTVKVKVTKKVWDDGVPVLKYLDRGGWVKRELKPGTYEILETKGKSSGADIYYWVVNREWMFSYDKPE